MRRSHLGLLVIGLIVVGGCGKREFKEFTSADGRFKVQMPGTPKEQSQVAGGANFKMFSVESRNEAYMVGYGDMPIPPKESEQQIQNRLDGARDGAVKNIKGTLVKETKVSLSGNPGREIEATAKLGNQDVTFRGRFYLVGTRLHQIAVVGPSSFANSADASKFLESLTLTK